MIYVVTKREVWEQPVKVEADSTDEAVTKVRHQEGAIMEDSFEYSHDLPSDDWTVETISEWNA